MSMDTRVAKILGRDDVAANGGRNGVGSRSRAAGISASSSCDHGPGVRGGAGHGGDSDRPGIQASKCLQGSGGASAGGIFEVAPGSQAPAAPWKAIVAPGHGATSGFGGTSAPGSTGTVVHPRPSRFIPVTAGSRATGSVTTHTGSSHPVAATTSSTSTTSAAVTRMSGPSRRVVNVQPAAPALDIL